MDPQWKPPDDYPYPPPPAYGPPGYTWAPPPQGPQWVPPPPGPSVVWAVLLWVLAVFSGVGVLVGGVIAYAGFTSNSYFDSYGVTTTATVTDLQVFTDTATVEFTTEDGTPATAEIVWLTDPPAVGDEVEITYDPYDPSWAIEAGSDSDAVMGFVFAAFAAAALAVALGAVVGAILVHRARGKARRRNATW